MSTQSGGHGTRQRFNNQTNLLCDIFCAAPLWQFHAVLGAVPNGTSAGGCGWESPSTPPGFSHGSGFQAFCETVSASACGQMPDPELLRNGIRTDHSGHLIGCSCLPEKGLGAGAFGPLGAVLAGPILHEMTGPFRHLSPEATAFACWVFSVLVPTLGVGMPSSTLRVLA